MLKERIIDSSSKAFTASSKYLLFIATFNSLPSNSAETVSSILPISELALITNLPFLISRIMRLSFSPRINTEARSTLLISSAREMVTFVANARGNTFSFFTNSPTYKREVITVSFTPTERRYLSAYTRKLSSLSNIREISTSVLAGQTIFISALPPSVGQ